MLCLTFSAIPWPIRYLPEDVIFLNADVKAALEEDVLHDSAREEMAVDGFVACVGAVGKGEGIDCVVRVKCLGGSCIQIIRNSVVFQLGRYEF